MAAKDPRGVFLRFRQESTLAELAKLASDHRGSEKKKSEIVERLVLWAKAAPPQLQKHIFDPEAPNPHRELTLSMEADHAFQRRRWIRAAHAYSRILAENGDPWTQNWSRYRVSFIWASLAYERRARALAARADDKPWEHEHELARRALLKASQLSKILAEMDGVDHSIHTIARYNHACCQCRLAEMELEQLMLGRQEGLSDTEADDLVRYAGKLLDASTGAKEHARKLELEALTQAATLLLGGDALRSKPIREHLDAAINSLAEIQPGAGEDSAQELSWVPELAENDPDTGLLRSLSRYEPSFQNQLTKWRQHEMDADAWLDRNSRHFDFGLEAGEDS